MRQLLLIYHDGAQEQMALVDQPGGDRLASEFGTRDCDVGLRGLLEPMDRAAFLAAAGFALLGIIAAATIRTRHVKRDQAIPARATA